MSWNYDPTQFNSTSPGTYAGSTVGVRNQIRWLMQDNQTSRQLLQDEEIDWAQTQEMNAYMAAAVCCETAAGRVANVKSKKVGDLELVYGSDDYTELANRLRARGQTYQAPYAGGISISDKQAQENNADWVTPSLFRGLGDNPGAVQPAPGDTANGGGFGPLV